ncbi:hypothetical protein OnM2_020019 [Erysiphe neolycopersici]|uniref:Uncharacterized protein n=1 Tax=Erysiphe neolycopersici TaxID=212602 RepID=A0A420I3D7_9PEZI|nr:hypothetical protein OnM2_020019 [Erysiphe neolycopersici]
MHMAKKLFKATTALGIKKYTIFYKFAENFEYIWLTFGCSKKSSSQLREKKVPHKFASLKKKIIHPFCSEIFEGILYTIIVAR